MAALNDGKTVHRTLRFKAYDLLVATNRPVAGTGYSGLKAALERLQGTQIETNIITGGVEQIDGFSLIDRYRIVSVKPATAACSTWKLPSPIGSSTRLLVMMS
jgi:plasmid replication initiation protein